MVPPKDVGVGLDHPTTTGTEKVCICVMGYTSRRSYNIISVHDALVVELG